MYLVQCYLQFANYFIFQQLPFGICNLLEPSGETHATSKKSLSLHSLRIISFLSNYLLEFAICWSPTPSIGWFYIHDSLDSLYNMITWVSQGHQMSLWVHALMAWVDSLCIRSYLHFIFLCIPSSCVFSFSRSFEFNIDNFYLQRYI